MPLIVPNTGSDDELAQAYAEIDRLKALLPPAPGPGQRWRVGTKVGQNVYLHEADDPVGRPVGQMASAEIAAFVCQAANAYLAAQGTEPSL